MNSFGQLLCFGAGTFCLGMALTFGVIFSLASRHSYEGSGEGCLGIFLCLIPLGFAIYFFVAAAG